MVAFTDCAATHLVVSLFRVIVYGMDEKPAGVGISPASIPVPAVWTASRQKSLLVSVWMFDSKASIGERPIIARRGITQAAYLF
jgi:hypothetical protein